jgi:hypothetical protein
MRAVKKLRDRDMSPFLISPTWDSPEADDQGWAFRWHGGENPKDASPFSIHAFGDSKEDSESKDALSFLQVSFRSSGFASSLKHLRPLFLAGVNA